MRHRARWLPVAVVLAVGLISCQGGTPDDAPPADQPSVSADIVQLRRDQVLQRVEVALHNGGSAELFVQRLRLQVEGFDLPGARRKDEPILPGQVVNLPVPFSGVSCPDEGPPRIGPARVTLRARYGDDPEPRTLRLTADDTDGLLLRIATRACAVQRVQREVDLRFADDWRLEHTSEGDVLHGELRARLLEGGPRTISMVAGAILYGLRPDTPTREPLASLTPGRPDARIPVVAYSARCTGHTIGEIKKPYEFLVWVSTPDGEDLAVTPTVGERTKRALRQVCSF